MMTPPQDKEPMPPVQEVVVEAPPPPLPLPPQPHAQAPPAQKADESSKLDNQSISSLVDLIPILDAAHSEAEQRDSGRVLELFEAAHARIPAYEDIERTKPYNPRNIFATAAYYPQKPATVSEQFVKRLDESTLFFIFYYQPGTFQQYLAARELMRNSWRYHKQSRQWFKRREPPVESSVDYEFGTFTVFDQEGAWCDRRKPDFKFEYAHLERYGLSDV
jgi:CCR4-NOT transcription complex subunit 3